MSWTEHCRRTYKIIRIAQIIQIIKIRMKSTKINQHKLPFSRQIFRRASFITDIFIYLLFKTHEQTRTSFADILFCLLHFELVCESKSDMSEIGTSFKLPDGKIIDKSFEAYIYRGVFVFMKKEEIIEVIPKDSFSEVKENINL